MHIEYVVLVVKLTIFITFGKGQVSLVLGNHEFLGGGWQHIPCNQNNL